VLAATLLNVRSGGQLSDATAALVKAALTGCSADADADADADAAAETLAALPPSEQADALNLILRTARRMPDLTKMFTAASNWAAATPALAERVADGIREFKKRLNAEAVVDMKQSGAAELFAVVAEIRDDPDADQMARDVAGTA